ncbi:MAG: hypothetical protein ACRDP6_43020 [Actinoallomurus sp.]
MTNYNIGGDQINQHGSGNIGKIDQRSGRTIQKISSKERAQAAIELAEFIEHLENVGLISKSGQMADVKAVEAAVAEHESGLRKVAIAVKSGATQAISAVVDHVATPVLLKLIQQYFS